MRALFEVGGVALIRLQSLHEYECSVQRAGVVEHSSSDASTDFYTQGQLGGRQVPMGSGRRGIMGANREQK